MQFEKYSEDDYEAVCDFLMELNRDDRSHINWNWARFEWMYEHPEFDKKMLTSIGLWRDKGKVIGAVIYDMYFGEGFCGILSGYKTIYPEVLKYVCSTLKDDGGFSLAVCDNDFDEIKVLQEQGFSVTGQSECIMEMELSGEFVAITKGGEIASFCGVWYSDKTDYAYIEPVCTIPEWRGRGIAKAVIFKALNRAEKMGANKAYVISDMDFYTKLGFVKKYHYTFYNKGWKDK